MRNLQKLKLTVQFAIVFVFLIIFSTATQAQSIDNTLFWEISGNGLKKPSYIFGTYHLIGKGFVDTMRNVNKKLAAADAVVGEIVLGGIGTVGPGGTTGTDSSIMKLPQYILLKTTTLDKILTAEEYKQVADYMKKAANMDIKFYNSFTPAFIVSSVSQAMAPKTFTNDNPAIDKSFQDYARAHNKPVIGLASSDAQTKVMYGGTLESQKELLLRTARNWEKSKDQSVKMYQLYITQDLAGLEKMFSTDSGYTQEEMDKLLKNRNLNWIAQLPQLMQGRSLFIAVGAAHLFGNDGLVKGLHEKGYKVKPMRTN